MDAKSRDGIKYLIGNIVIIFLYLLLFPSPITNIDYFGIPLFFSIGVLLFMSTFYVTREYREFLIGLRNSRGFNSFKKIQKDFSKKNIRAISVVITMFLGIVMIWTKFDDYFSVFNNNTLATLVFGFQFSLIFSQYFMKLPKNKTKWKKGYLSIRNWG